MRLVLIAEGHGETSALPVLVRRLLSEKGQGLPVFVDRDVIRLPSSRVFRPYKGTDKPDLTDWLRAVTIGVHRQDTAAVLAIYDGDLPSFPPGSRVQFCAARAAKALAVKAKEVGAGKRFSLSVVFACAEYETWLIAGIESLRGRQTGDGRSLIPKTAAFPSGDAESHGKRWLEQNCLGYRPSRDQGALTELLDLSCVRSKKLRSFRRLEHALKQLVNATMSGSHISTPE
ncbi:MAG: DUF4276 family protein [Limisphaerales bacterium]